MNARIRGDLIALYAVVALSLIGCRETRRDLAAAPERLDDAAIASQASVGPFQPRKALVITDNDEAFASKLRLVEGARASIEMMYYVYHHDYTSSVLSEALLAAAARGVDVRLLIDYNTNYSSLDFFSMLEQEASSGPGSLQVRFYNRPTRRVVEDAVYMTMGCSQILEAGGEACDERKYAVIEEALAAEGIPTEKNISNVNFAKSGLFLSGWYSKRPGVMALAVTEGQNLDLEALKESASGAGEGLESVKRLALTYWRSRNGPLFQRVANRLKLALAVLIYRGKIDDLKETMGPLFPLRRLQARDWRDWEFLTDYLHQKLLLVDGVRVQLGGRNIGDSYHMRSHALLGEHHLFADTDVYLELDETTGETFREVFDRLWGFEAMVATTGDIRRHAPNDFVANEGALRAAEEECAAVPEVERQSCIDREFAGRTRGLEERTAARREEMLHNAEKYREHYSGASPAETAAPFEIDAGARVAYLENLPFDKDRPSEDRTRRYGAQGLGEAAAGKYLHRIWRLGLTNACASATAAAPQRVLILNAYYLPPANLLQAAAEMIDGGLDCRHVTVQVLTNSVETTNFDVINLLAHHGLKAFAEFYREEGDPEQRARFEFYEYREKPEIPNFTLHSKMSILGDDIIIGSANADVRSYMMDSNNGVFIRGASGLRERYLELLDSQIGDPEIVTDLGEHLRYVSREDMRAEHLRVFRGLLDAYSLEDRLSEDQCGELEGIFTKILDGVHDQTLAVLRGEEGALDRYNQLLKIF